ncbi:CPBP family intramembrane glutamic endopeptidase [Alienimonas chondri]|uniref:CAAX prenyl protease 2/Lysostaphin resistance protein A-like domain-containing protein n=1 Tax=Alienimonas chondri TaxID=2681879 RepID=A0ABX1VBM2_9PLAN|nr:type II CAAX endopeptidase family protein [Alienimonas chondri]NNJ24451.1 hypothetical protein [Alienimonas chondri]
MILPPPGLSLTLFTVACGVGMWGIEASRRQRGESLLPQRPLPSVALWGAAAGAGIWVLATALAGGLPGDHLSPLARSVARAGLIACGATALWSFAVDRSTPRRLPSLASVRDGLLTLLLALPPTAIAFAATLFFRTQEGGNEMLLRLLEGTPSTWAAVTLSAVVFAPIGEELLFRGLLLGSLRTAGVTVVPAVMASAALFALLHPVQDWAPLFVLACVLGWSRERTGSILPAIIAHAGFNALMLAWALLDGFGAAA